MGIRVSLFPLVFVRHARWSLRPLTRNSIQFPFKLFDWSLFKFIFTMATIRTCSYRGSIRRSMFHLFLRNIAFVALPVFLCNFATVEARIDMNRNGCGWSCAFQNHINFLFQVRQRGVCSNRLDVIHNQIVLQVCHLCVTFLNILRPTEITCIYLDIN